MVGGEGEGEGEAPPPDVSERGCERLEERPGRRVEIAAGDVAGLVQAVNTAAPGDRIFLADGTYELVGQYIWIDVDDVSLRGASGDRDAVVLDGGYTTTEVVTVAASDVWVADLTIRRAFTHPIHVTGAQGGNADRTVIHNVRLTDPGQQAIKINQRGGGDGGGGQTYADDGVIACSWIELTDAGRPEIRDNCYTGGVDAHQAWGWRIHDNHIEGFWCEGGLSEHGVHMWRGCRDTVVERNTIVNCARGVGFGLVNSPADNQRMPDIAGGDDPCPELREGAYVDHWGGTVRNNMIFADDPGLFASQSGFDGGVSMWNACAVTVAHNTVWSTQAPFLSIETRFDGTYALVANNLVSHRIQARTEGTAELLGNVQDAGAAWFVDAVGGDLHLAPGGGSPAHGGGADLPEGVCDEDFDGDPRTPPRDVGADELP